MNGIESVSHKECIICEKCKWTNILVESKEIKRKKRNRMIYIDDVSFAAIKSYSGDFGSIGNFLKFLLGIYQRDKMRLDVATNMAGLD